MKPNIFDIILSTLSQFIYPDGYQVSKLGVCILIAAFYGVISLGSSLIGG